jgi:hypothetical protein
LLLFRHYVELVCKEIIKNGSTNLKPRKIHTLDVLWQDTRKIIVSRVSEVSPETLDEIQKFILEIHHHDPDGQAARYDADRQNKPTLQNLPLIIDRENMLFEMDKVRTYLDEWNKKVWRLRINE